LIQSFSLKDINRFVNFKLFNLPLQLQYRNYSNSIKSFLCHFFIILSLLNDRLAAVATVTGREIKMTIADTNLE
jgi:hypothetical protein